MNPTQTIQQQKPEIRKSIYRRPLRQPRRKLEFQEMESRRCLSVDFVAHDIGPNEIQLSGTIRVADFDMDGDLDFATFAHPESGVDTHVSWYENLDGKGTFGPGQPINELPITWIEVADMDGDGDPDLVSASYSFTDPDPQGQLAWYANDGQGNFGAPNVIGHDDMPQFFTISDIDGDSDPDIVSRFQGRIAWHENIDGQGTFGPQTPVATLENQLYKVKTADVDGDGDQDIIWDSYEDSTLRWSENRNDKGDFGPERVLSATADNVWNFAAADFDSDGDTDVISATAFSEKQQLSLYENSDGNGDFGKERIVATGPHWTVATADIDGDGHLDLVAGVRNDVVWYANTGRAFGPEQFVDKVGVSFTIANSTQPADIDGDGDIDILVNVFSNEREGRIVWYENRSIVRSERIIGDANNDGRFDSSDLVLVFQAAEYEDDTPGNSTFEEGDWNDDGDFGSEDLVLAFQLGEYEADVVAATESIFEEAGIAKLIDPL